MFCGGYANLASNGRAVLDHCSATPILVATWTYQPNNVKGGSLGQPRSQHPVGFALQDSHLQRHGRGAQAHNVARRNVGCQAPRPRSQNVCGRCRVKETRTWPRTGVPGTALCRNDSSATRPEQHNADAGLPREARLGAPSPAMREAAARPISAVAAPPFTHRVAALIGRRWATGGGPEGRSRRNGFR